MKKKIWRRYLIGLVLLAAFYLGGCGQNSVGNNTNTTVSNTNNNTNNNTNVSKNSATTENIDGTPAAVTRDYHDALVKKDIEGMKKTLSKDALAWFAGEAKKNKVTLDEYLKNIADNTSDNGAIFVNKSSDDKTALVCLKDQSSENTGIFAQKLVKENGEWKFEAHKTYQYMDLIDEARNSEGTERSRQAFQKAMKIMGKDYCP